MQRPDSSKYLAAANRILECRKTSTYNSAGTRNVAKASSSQQANTSNGSTPQMKRNGRQTCTLPISDVPPPKLGHSYIEFVVAKNIWTVFQKGAQPLPGQAVFVRVRPDSVVIAHQELPEIPLGLRFIAAPQCWNPFFFQAAQQSPGERIASII